MEERKRKREHQDNSDEQRKEPFCVAQESFPPEIIEAILFCCAEDVVSITVCRFVCTLWWDILRPLPSLQEYMKRMEAQHCRQRVDELKTHVIYPSITFASVVAERGWLSVLSWARDKGCDWNETTCASAARGGHSEILQWLRQRECPWNILTSLYAAWSGNTEMLRWVIEQGCVWERGVQVPNQNAICVSARKGDLDAVIFLAGLSTHLPSEIPAAAAAEGGQLEILKWLKDNRNLQLDSKIALGAASGGSFEMLRWLNVNGYEFDLLRDEMVQDATKAENLDTLNYLLQSKGIFFWDIQPCVYAARVNAFKSLRWLHEIRHVALQTECFQMAARHGNREMLQWLLESGCNWDASVCKEAAREGHLEVLKWLRDKGCPWDKRTIKFAANGRISDWAKQNGCPLPKTANRGGNGGVMAPHR